MAPDDAISISVTMEWNGWQSATTRLTNLREVHWHQPKVAPHPMSLAHISCADILSGELPHACDPSTAPHRIQVCILRSRNIRSTYAELARRADQTVAAATPARTASRFIGANTRGW